ncbi:Maf family nucleotide pyrophosphatase [Acetobacter sp. AN02]|uniref:Maf family protein n=1 Tax=Acetobacter sp. AN02 TaxID=2894186 RepID=UPI00243442F0|nr:Maf family nucleotide pyrophosphatase [Acetobacter sp. AN02]MDG6094264.1 Maf family nucleotide pyrophosphatase [Acetobacter sp. AN02]
MSTDLILASTSVTRQKILSSAGVPFTAVRPEVNEGPLKEEGRAHGSTPDEVASALARAKAAAVSALHPGSLVIGADQMLSCDGAWFDKPEDMADARRQLCRLRGREHHLHTAVVLIYGGRVLWQHVARPELVMRDFSDAFLDRYLEEEGEACLSSVGAYRLEGAGIHLFASVSGEHSAVLGLPLLPLLEGLRVCGAIADV